MNLIKIRHKTSVQLRANTSLAIDDVKNIF